MSFTKQITDGHRSTVILVALTMMTASGLWFDDLFGTAIGSWVADVRNDRGNTAEAGKATQKHYVGLLAGEKEDAGRMDALVVQDAGAGRRPRREVIQNSGATRPTRDILPWELIPNTSVMFKGAPLEINQFGHRAWSEYTEAKPEGTFRIALVGGSNTMGSGVLVEQTFACLLEQRLNAELGGRAHDRFEIINFSVGGYHLPERVFLLQNKVGAFEPDLILVSAADRDLTIQHDRIARKLSRGRREPVDLTYLKKIIRKAGVRPREDKLDRMVRKLRPFQEDILLGGLDALTIYSRENDTEVAVFLLRRVGGKRIGKDLKATYEIMQKSEVTILTLFEAYEGVSEMELWLHPNPNPDLGDPHPNIEGHRRIADNLFEELMGDAKIGAMLRGE